MDFKKSVSNRTATLMRAVELSQKVAPPPQQTGPKLPANRGANYAAGRMGAAGGQLLDHNNNNNNSSSTVSSRSLKGDGGDGSSSDTPYVAMDSSSARGAASSILATAGRAAASASTALGCDDSNNRSSSSSSKNIQRFQADHVPIVGSSNTCNNSARMVNTQSTTTASAAAAGTGLPSSPKEELAFFWELMHFAQHRNWKKKVLSVLICISSFIVLIDLIFFHHVRNIIEAFLQWMTVHPFLAVLTFLVFFIIATLLFVPPIILFFGAGFAFCNVCGFWYGIVIATIVSCIGSTIGAVLAFVRSRYVMRELVELFAKRYPIVKAADQAFARNGFHVMLLLRLCPIIPFNGLNYIGGVTNIELDQFVYALVGIVPTVIFWVFVGASADKLASNTADDVSEQILLVALLTTGVLFALAALVLLFRYAKEELRKEIAADRAHNWHTYQKPSTSSSTEFAMESGAAAGVIQHSDSDELREEGFEMLAQYPTDVLAVLGITESPLENDRIPEDLHDEEWFWVWT